MNINEYINSQGRTVHTRNNISFVAAQHESAFSIIEEFIQTVKPEKILEIGAAEGGLTRFINLVGQESNKKFKMISTDIHDRDEYTINKIEGVDMFIENIFDWGSGLLTNNTVHDFLTSNDRKIIFCDGGDKISEFKLLAKYLNVGDFILAHDYIDTPQNFRDNYFGKIWNWQEVSEADIQSTCELYSLVDCEKQKFNSVAWTCKQKI
jgi:hypothetical protein